MTANEKIPWKRLSVEAVAIVFSILSAFALQAWWDARAEARSERIVLMTLAQELDSADAQLQLQLSNYAFLEKATESVADQLVAAGVGQSIAIPDTYLAALLLDMTFNPPMGTTNTLLASGQVSMLQNRELGVALTEWPAWIQDALEEQTALWRLGDEHLEPLLHQAVLNLAPAYQILTEWEKHSRLVVEESGGESSVVSSPELWNVLYQRLTFLNGGRNELQVAGERLKRMITLVRQELD